MGERMFWIANIAVMATIFLMGGVAIAYVASALS
jgi:hypothetical protein